MDENCTDARTQSYASWLCSSTFCVAHFTDVLLKCRDGCPWLWSQSFLNQLPLPGDTEPQHSLAAGGDKGGFGGSYSKLSASWINWSKAHLVHCRC